MKQHKTYLAVTAALLLCAGCMTGCGSDAAYDNTMIAADAAAGEAAHEGAAPEAAAKADGDTALKADAVYDTEDAFYAEAEAADEAMKAVLAADAEPSAPLADAGEPFVLTAGEWNDNDNWGFFLNLVHSGTIAFPVYGLNPTNRIAVTVTHEGAPVRNQTVTLSAGDEVLWTAATDRDGMAYLFYDDAYAGETLLLQSADAEDISVVIPAAEDGSQGGGAPLLAYEMETAASAQSYDSTEVMFILDTTGSMGDEISYLQKDFAAIAEEVSDDSITFSVNFYKDAGDEYVMRCNPFTDDVKDIQKKLNAEYADGGGDTPEAVAEILDETMNRGDWHGNTNKIAFLIFDAPPHNTVEKQQMVLQAIAAAAARGVHLVPVVASNAERDTELFGRAAAIMTNSNYVFLTDDSGVGESHLEPIIGDYDVELLHDIIVRNIREIAGEAS